MTHNAPQRPVRAKLTLPDTTTEPLLASLNLHGDELHAARAFARDLHRSRNAWSIRSAATRSLGRISRKDAEAELRRALAALNQGGGDA